MTRSGRRFAYLLLTPAAIFCLAFVGWPLIRLITSSFYDYSSFGGERAFVGFANFTTALSAGDFRSATVRTLLYTAVVVIAEFMLGLAVALLFTALGERSKILRTVFLYPLMIAPVVAGLLWKFLLIDNFGIVNELMSRVGLPSDVGWLSDAGIVLWAVAVPDIWLTTPFMTLVLFAGLQGIDRDVIDAARMDGANYWRLLRNIVLPLLRPVLAVALIIRGVDAVRAFDIILAQTGGGPQNASETLSLLVYRTMIRYDEPGLASAMSSMYLVVLTVVALAAIYMIWRPRRSAA